MFDVLNECHNNDSVQQLRVTSGEMGSIQTNKQTIWIHQAFIVTVAV